MSTNYTGPVRWHNQRYIAQKEHAESHLSCFRNGSGAIWGIFWILESGVPPLHTRLDMIPPPLHTRLDHIQSCQELRYRY